MLRTKVWLGATLLVSTAASAQTIPPIAIDTVSPSTPQSEFEREYPDAVSAVRRAYLRPATGRVPLAVHSPRLPQRIGIWVPVTFAPDDGSAPERDEFALTICSTPCTLYVRPGRFRFNASGPGIVSGNLAVTVPSGGATFWLRAPSSRTQMLADVGLTVGIIALACGIAALVTVIAATPAPSRYTTPYHNESGYIGAGITISVGSALTLVSMIAFRNNPGGIAATGAPPLESAERD